MTSKEAVKRYLDRKMLLDIKYGGEHAEDVSPGGWFDEWNQMIQSYFITTNRFTRNGTYKNN